MKWRKLLLVNGSKVRDVGYSFLTQSELIEPVLSQAAQLGIHLYCFITKVRDTPP